MYFKELTLTIKKFFVGLSILQNGRMPQFLSEEQLQEVFVSENPHPCLLNLKNGLRKLGIYQVSYYNCQVLPWLINKVNDNFAKILQLVDSQSLKL